MKAFAATSALALLSLTGACDGDPPEPSPPPSPGAENVRINELSSSGFDPVELHNAGDEDVDLGGWLLTDDIAHGVNASLYDPQDKKGELVFAPGTLIAAGGYLVINKGDGAGMHPFGLSGDGDTVSLLDASLTLVDQVTYGSGEAEVSYCLQGGTWGPCEASFGADNVAKLCGNGRLDEGELCDGASLSANCVDLGGFLGGSLACSADCLAYETSACERPAPPACDLDGLRLNEVCHKDSKCGVEGITSGDWLEIYNGSGTESDISGCYLRIFAVTGLLRVAPQQLASVRGLEFATVPAGGFLVIDDHKPLVDMADDNRVELLAVDGETLVNGLVTSSAYQEGQEACSIDEPGDSPTPGASNVCSEG